MPEDSTVEMTDESKMLLVKSVMESGKGLEFMLDVLKDPRSRVTLRIEIEVTRIPAKQD